MFNNIGITEVLIVAAVLIFLFGASKLPKFARGLGESGRELKNATKDLKEALDDDASV